MGTIKLFQKILLHQHDEADTPHRQQDRVFHKCPRIRREALRFCGLFAKRQALIKPRSLMPPNALGPGGDTFHTRKGEVAKWGAVETVRKAYSVHELDAEQLAR